MTIIISWISVVSLLFLIFSIIGMWRIFEKCGEAGWISLIPFYSSYKLYAVVWDSVLYGINLALSIFASLMMWWSPVRGMDALCAGIIASIIVLIINIIFSIRLARSFGKGIGFAIGLIFLPFVFMMILAFGKAEFDSDF